MEKVLAYLEGTLLDQYLELLPSRWSALLPRLAKRTQRLQTLTDLTTVNELESAVEEDFELATKLLHAEHRIYQEGVTLFDGLSQASDLVRHTWRLLANDLLAELAAKELMLAHWKAAVTTITADTLRVYSHALLVHARVTTARVHHLMALLREEEAG
ncbi:conserved hypothetical protein [Leishmania infantum JPCM5]|uniref:Uncharacterized protein n=2 Tax=Leishmania infantum TaxID=5671 RepID=A4I6B0_LEIIN|nr:conserved hypothetical protein [Leishmania infantum JPCM5]CAC9517327.1 hypothetical_protein_-_conserved [Leishmania infantum]CAM70334.1 conserved hypothetical protein [Leishmania infantum JPCM5]SUZ44219.1 hypothetical_protein_-_conserved [Leishmania infantum]|eukprot:XP_001467279.1 conserved hypothetical protein [Leishmania infantum JPCM5]